MAAMQLVLGRAVFACSGFAQSFSNHVLAPPPTPPHPTPLLFAVMCWDCLSVG